jgi:hypothetical protein
VSEIGWLALALVAGALLAYGWIKRELWVHRRRARARRPPPDRTRR